MGLILSPAKTQIVPLAEEFDFLGFRIKWMRKRGTDKWRGRCSRRRIQCRARRISRVSWRSVICGSRRWMCRWGSGRWVGRRCW